MVWLCLLSLARKGYFTSVHQKFFFTGHSYNDCDRDFGLLEKEGKSRKIWTPNDISSIIRDARTENPFSVVNVQQPQILNFWKLVDLIRFPTNFRITHYHWFEYKRLDDGFFAREDYSQGVSLLYIKNLITNLNIFYIQGTSVV